MQQYLDLLRDVRDNGVRKPTRAVLASTGKHVDALSVFGRQIRFDLNAGFPLVTTKRVSFNAIFYELAWFLRGSSNIKYLTDNDVHIWDAWASEDGELGPLYPKQWRAWAAPGGQSVDQISQVIQGIKDVKADPTAAIGRRLVVSAWNVADIPSMALAPCHAIFQFNVTGSRLSCHLLCRSWDLFLGAPFNVGSYALLTHLIAQVTGLGVGDLVISAGDAHVYSNHIESIDEQLTRKPLPLPTLRLDPAITDIDAFRREHIKLVGYRAHPALRGEVAV